MGFITDFFEKRVGEAQMDTVTAKLAETIYFKELAFHIGKSYIANAISKCEFKVFKNGEAVKDECYYAWNVSPNPNQNSSQFLNKLINVLYDKNEALVIPNKGCLYIADSFSVDEKPMQENVFSCISIEGHSVTKKYKASEVFYFKLDNKSVKKLVDDLYVTYGQLFACAVESFKKSNGKKYKLILDNMKAGDRQFAEQFNTVIKEQLKAFMENDNAVYPQFKGTDLQPFDSSSQNADDVLKLRKEIFEITAQGLKIPLPMMYGNITNIQEIVKIFLTFCIDPLCDMISEEITRKINTYITWNGGKNFVRVDTSRINHIDILDVAEKADKLIASGICSVDELREVLDYQPLNTEFSAKHWITKNYTDVEQEAQTGGEKDEEAVLFNGNNG